MKPLHRTAIKFGLIGSGAHVFIFFIYYFTGANPLLEMSIIDIFILPIFLYFGIREFRDVHNGQWLKFWEGMTTGLMIYMLIAATVGGFLWVFLTYVDTALIGGYIDHSVNQLIETKDTFIKELGEEAYHQHITETKATTPKILVMDHFFRRVAMGFGLTSLISIVMKKQENKD